jgi:hypothetical protein
VNWDRPPQKIEMNFGRNVERTFVHRDRKSNWPDRPDIAVKLTGMQRIGNLPSFGWLNAKRAASAAQRA